MDEAELMPGDVDLDVTHSAINYKDGLAITGERPVVRRFPMIPGVDLAGRVTRSTHPDFKPGDRVVATGCGVGESHFGGFAEKARLNGDWLTHLPDGLTAARAMTAGTAGLTAMFCLLALERHGRTPADGTAIVTGAAGGVGSFAVALLARAGWRVAAVTGRESEADYLRQLGASEILARDAFATPGKLLQEQRFAAGVDTVGGVTLANLLAQTRCDGAIAACGNVGGMDLPTSVAPFILRGVRLIGINGNSPMPLRTRVWGRMATDLRAPRLDRIATLAEPQAIGATMKTLLDSAGTGRTVIRFAG